MKKKSGRRPAPGTHTQRQKILHAVLTQVAFDGWSERAWTEGIRQAGVSRAEAERLMPNGIRDVIEEFGAEADVTMQARIKAAHGFAQMRVRDKIAFAVRARLEFLTPHREAMRRLLHWYARPRHAAQGVQRVAKTVDLMWRAAGDTSTDYNFYTKRILLAGVLNTTILYWLDDASPGCEASWRFLDRRISEILKVGKTISLLKEFTPAEVVDFTRRKMRRG